jgi:hypothetical protein
VTTWLIIERAGPVFEPGRSSFDIQRNGRSFAYDMDDLEEAENRIAKDRHFDPLEDKITLVGTDGYRTPISLRNRRRRP